MVPVQRTGPRMERSATVAKIFSSLPFGVPKQQISPILIDLVLCEYLSLQIEKIRVEHPPPTITLDSASSSSFDMALAAVPLLPWLGPPFFVEIKRCSDECDLIIPKLFHL